MGKQGGSGNFNAARGVMKGAGFLGVGAALTVAGLYSSMYTVPGGHAAVIYNRFTGVKPTVTTEGTHFLFPWIETPTIFDIRARPSTIRSPTGTRDLQTVDISLRVLYKPIENELPNIMLTLGPDYEDKVMPSIVNETLKSIVAQFNASELITQREQVSRLIARNLAERALPFNITISDVSITHLLFGKEYRAAIEAKQVAQQEAERAKFIVKQALQDKRSTIIKAEGEAKSAELIGQAVAKNSAYLELRRLEAAQSIANVVSEGNNNIYLDANALLHNVVAKSGSTSGGPKH